MTDVVSRVIEAIDEGNSAYYGLRIDQDRACEKGSPISPSRVWVNGEPSGRKLAGVSAIGLPDFPKPRDVQRVLDKLSIYIGDRIVLVGGERQEYGEDEGEVILIKAVCLGWWGRT